MISQASSEHSVCFAVPESQGQLAKEALEERFSKAIAKGRIRKVWMTETAPRMVSTPSPAFYTLVSDFKESPPATMVKMSRLKSLRIAQY